MNKQLEKINRAIVLFKYSQLRPLIIFEPRQLIAYTITNERL